MKVGTVIKYYRVKRNLTQSQLADGICSIPHLSKIENNSYSANEETATLLLDKLGVELSSEFDQYLQIKSDLDHFVEAVLYYDIENINMLGKKLQKLEEMFARTDLINLYHAYMIRFFLFNNHFKKATAHQKMLEKLRVNFTPLEELLYSFNAGLLLLADNKVQEAKDHFLQLKSMSLSNNPFIIRDLFYQISLCFSLLNKPEKAVTYAKQALIYYKEENNYIRTVHTQMILGINYARLGLYDEGIEVYKVLLRNTRLLQLNDLYHQIIYNYSLLLFKKKDYNGALAFLYQAIKVFAKGSRHHILSHLAIIEILLLTNKDTTSIREHINEVIKYSQSTQLKKYRLLAQKFELQLQSKTDMYQFIENQLFPFLKKNDHVEEKMKTALELAQYYQELKEIDLANVYFNEYIVALKKEE
ncbi:helix-turn-helix domain-containing protein [Halalkalibacter akibai]|uniref:Transcriptional activator n=1 Tax=Halalkalibacter akibai (strain ATCC 43226 / DSM 21942 / CIP 109018 / JCM 9157 / 1139) TaxID=1236973 RepID=W4QMC8_HALA3|nr:helix-turn-helix transcriptional regulator [Halalkalibacter akibai]GAE33251.1 transcriptional activator [Halalkalibacter akibai JCM 9157]